MLNQLQSQIHELLFTVLQTIFVALGTAAGYGIKIWINSMNSSWKRSLTERLVKYAEQKIEGDTAKQQWVAQQLSEKLKGRVTPEEVDHLIEEAFVNMKAQLTPAVATTTVIAPATEVKPI